MLAMRIAVFLLTVSLGIITSALARNQSRESPAVELAAVDHDCHPRVGEQFPSRCLELAKAELRTGTGSASCSGTSRGPLETELPGDPVKNRDSHPEEPKGPGIVSRLRILDKEEALYTAEARSNGIQGTVTLRVTFLASGRIGSITTVRGLPFGLTEQAIEAARMIEFEAEKVDGVPRTTTRPVSYTFNIY